MQPSRYPNVYERYGKQKKLYTKSLAPGISVYGERTQRDATGEYREWDPRRSKLCAAMMNGLATNGMSSGSHVLYLGCSSGTTVSHVSDILSKHGLVFAVDVAPVVLRELVFVAKDRGNIVPLLTDANDVETLAKQVTGVDVLFQDIAQKHQVQIFLKNQIFLRPGGLSLLSVKARSINVGFKPKEVFDTVRKELQTTLSVEQAISLEPFEKDHMLFVCKKR